MADLNKLKKKTEAMLRAVLISSPRGVPLRRLDREYRSIIHQPIPFLELGFSSLEEYIKSIPDVAVLARDIDGDVLVKGVASESDQHVAKLIAKQKKPKIKAKTKSRRPLMRPQVVTPRSTVPRVGPRFIPPRLMKQALSQATAQVARDVHRDARAFSNSPLDSNSSRRVELASGAARAPRTVTATRTVTVVPCQVEASTNNWNNKPRWTGNGTYCQEMEVSLRRDPDNPSGYDRVVKVPHAFNAKTTNQGAPQGKDLEIYSQIKKLLETKPKGLWLTRVGAEYKKYYGCELPSNILEQLKSLPHVARCEQFPGGSILYPSTVPEERPVDKNQSHQTSGSESSTPFEFYTLRPQEPPPKGAVREVSVSHVESASHFFVHYKHNWQEIDSLQSQLEDFFLMQSSKKDSLPMLKEGMFCCAQFTADDGWYRARITECHSEAQTVQVIYVDFGNFETLPASRLCLLRREHAELPMLAALCTLEGVEPSSQERDKWNSTSVERFKELCTANDELKMTVVGVQGHHLVVKLTAANGTDIKAALLKESHTAEESETSSSTSTSTDTTSSISSSEVSSSEVSSRSSASSSSVPSALLTSSSHLKASSASSEMQVKELEQRQNNTRPFLRHRFFSRDDSTLQKVTETVQMPDDDYVDVFVCNVHSTDNICVNFYGEEYSDKLAAIEQSMLCHFEEPSSQETPAEVKTGSIFAVYSKDIHSEGLWYRVKVHKVKGDKAHVEYMDYGETGTVPLSSLKCIPLRFLELPFQACSLSLHGLPKTKNPEVILKIKHLVLGKQLVAEVVKRVGATVSVELYDMSSEVDININTVLRSLVIPDDELAPVLPKVGEQIDVFVTFVEGSKVFIQIPGGGTSRLEELLSDISEHYSQPIKAAEFVSKPQPEMMCCAKSSDGSWYRALVTKVLPDRQVEVQYVDYGNFEQLPVSSLREPAKAISHVNSLPFQALECHLEGVNETTWSRDLSHRLEETVLGRNAVLEVVPPSDVPVVRLFLPSDDHDEGLVSVAKLIGLEKSSLVPLQEDLTATGDSLREEHSLAEWVDDGSIDGDSVASESSSIQEEIDKKASGLPPTLDLSKPFVDIVVIEADDPSNFVFQCLEHVGELQTHENKIQQYYVNKKRTPFKDIRAGVLCAVHHATDDTWYRALVKATLSPQQVCVCFVDYGDFGIVPSHSLQHLPEEFRELPFMAVQGSLQGVEPVGDDTAEWCDEAKQRFEKLTVDKRLVAKPRRSRNYGGSFGEESKMQLELYDTSDPQKDVLIADVLVSEGLAKRIAGDP